VENLVILWTNSDEIVFDKMVAMYARNSKIEHWWNEITIIIWGSTARLAAESDIVAERIKELLQIGVIVSACKACSDSLGVSDKLIKMGIELKYWGDGLTKILKDNEKLLTV
jgi:hypothetical protein